MSTHDQILRPDLKEIISKFYLKGFDFNAQENIELIKYFVKDDISKEEVEKLVKNVDNFTSMPMVYEYMSDDVIKKKKYTKGRTILGLLSKPVAEEDLSLGIVLKPVLKSFQYEIGKQSNKIRVNSLGELLNYLRELKDESTHVSVILIDKNNNEYELTLPTRLLMANEKIAVRYLTLIDSILNKNIGKPFYIVFNKHYATLVIIDEYNSLTKTPITFSEIIAYGTTEKLITILKALGYRSK